MAGGESDNNIVNASGVTYSPSGEAAAAAEGRVTQAQLDAQANMADQIARLEAQRSQQPRRPMFSGGGGLGARLKGK